MRLRIEQSSSGWHLFSEENGRKTPLLSGTVRACAYLGCSLARERGVMLEVGKIALNPRHVSEVTVAELALDLASKAEKARPVVRKAPAPAGPRSARHSSPPHQIELPFLA